MEFDHPSPKIRSSTYRSDLDFLPIRSKLTAGTSPSKRQLTLNKPISEASIDMEYLSRCDPAVYLTTFSDLRVQGMNVVSAVEELFVKLQQIPYGVILSALEVFLNL